MEDMRGRDLSPHRQNILGKGYGGCMKSESASQDGNDSAAQHAGGLRVLVCVRALD
jgi:hypothetical protein